MDVKVFKRSEDVILPQYQTDGAAGMDVRAYIPKLTCLADDGEIISGLRLEPFERVIIPTGLHVELPKGVELQVRPRSGLAYKKALTVVNSPGTVDSDFRGEIGVIIINLSPKSAIIHHEERIAQFVFAKHETCDWHQVDTLESLSDTTRGQGGFGSTGKK